MDLKPRHLNHKYLKGHFSISSLRSYVFYRKPSSSVFAALVVMINLTLKAEPFKTTFTHHTQMLPHFSGIVISEGDKML